jgi:signal transduction histidine kinase
MDVIWSRNDRPIPASYWVAAAIGSVVVLVCYLTAWWVPWFVEQMAVGVAPELSRFGNALMFSFGGGLGLAFGAAPWLALRWPALGISLAALPLVPTLMTDAPLHFGVFAGLCAVAVAAGWRSARATAWAAALAALVAVGWVLSDRRMAAPFRADVEQQYMGGHGAQLVTGLLYLAVVGLVLLGAWGLRRSAERELERRSLAARSGEVEEQAAVVGERARLARDLHDVVAHHVSLIAVRAETAPYTHPDLEAPARSVLADIAADARLALDELRGVLGILGRSGEGAARAPQPTWSDITALVERTRSAGVEVTLVGDAHEQVNAAAGYAAYRVVQEALTNARKHAPGRPVTVDLDATSQLLTVLVSTPLGVAQAPVGAGHGLIGMRERVEALGGRLLSGPVGQDFVVEAILPRGAA